VVKLSPCHYSATPGYEKLCIENYFSVLGFVPSFILYRGLNIGSQPQLFQRTAKESYGKFLAHSNPLFNQKVTYDTSLTRNTGDLDINLIASDAPVAT
jgi:hypothetical protein